MSRVVDGVVEKSKNSNEKVYFMNEYGFILALFLAIAVVVTIVAVIVYRSSLQDKGGWKNAKKKRFILGGIWIAVLSIMLSVTLPKSPYFMFENETPTKVVYVMAFQFGFNMANKEIDPKAPIAEAIEIKAGELVEFRVTSKDVNHGFGIYNDKMQLITQVQAMPGYINRLRWKFDKPGMYKVLCLEYCGKGHQDMRTVFIVK